MRDQLHTAVEYADSALHHIQNTRGDKYAPQDEEMHVEPMDLFEDHFGLPWLCGQVSKYAARIPRESPSKALIDIYKVFHYSSRIFFLLKREEGDG